MAGVQGSMEQERKIMLADIRAEPRAYQESCLALEIMKHADRLSAVGVVSERILAIIEEHQAVLGTVMGSAEILTEHGLKLQQALFNSEAFGHLDGSRDPILAIQEVLRQDKPPFEQIMYIHNLFISHVYGPLVGQLGGALKSEHDAYVRTIFIESGLFVKDRGRIDLPSPKMTDRSGTCKSRFYSGQLPFVQSHIRAVERHAPIVTSPFYQSQRASNLPFVAGISGHTGSFLLGLSCYGGVGSYGSSPVAEESWKEYLAAVTGFLVAGGIHSVDEIMVVGRSLDFPYERGNYLLFLPAVLKDLPSIRAIDNVSPDTGLGR